MSFASFRSIPFLAQGQQTGGELSLADFTALWHMDAALGADEPDATGNGNTLEDQLNSCDTTTGLLNSARQLGGVGKVLRTLNNANLAIAANQSWGAFVWVKFTNVSIGGNLMIFTEVGTTMQLQLLQGGGDSVKFNYYAGEVSTNPSLDNDWHLYCFGYNADLGSYYVSFDGGTMVTGSASGVAVDTNNDFYISDGSALNPCDVDEVGLVIGNYLTQANVAWLYNGGAGREIT